MVIQGSQVPMYTKHTFLYFILFFYFFQIFLFLFLYEKQNKAKLEK